IEAQRFNRNGVPLGHEFQVNNYTTSDQDYPRVAMDAEGDFVLTWDSETQDGSSTGVYARLYDARGTAQGNEFLVNTFTTNSQQITIPAMDSAGEFVITWVSNSQDGSAYGIYAKRYSRTGIAQGNEFLVNTFTNGSQNFPSIAMDADGDFVVAWHSSGEDGS